MQMSTRATFWAGPCSGWDQWKQPEGCIQRTWTQQVPDTTAQAREKLLPQEQLLSTPWSLEFPSEAADTFLPFLLSCTGTGEGQKAAMKWGGGVEKFNIHPSKDKTSLSRQTSLAGAGPSHRWWGKVENSTFKRLRMFPRQIPLYLHWEGCVTYLQ